MYMRTLFRGAKTCKIGENGVLLVMFMSFGKEMTKKIRKSIQKRVLFRDLGSILYLDNTCLGCVLKVLLGG